VYAAHHAIEGAGFEVWRPFPGAVDATVSDPFFLLDQLGPVEYAPNEAVGAPWHPHRGFETVTYMIDGAFEHTDSHGGGGLITDGSTQWMTAGSGVMHSELPPQEMITKGGLFHGVQLWVNLPKALKWTPPRYQDIAARDVSLLSSEDGGALVRVIAGDLAGYEGPGSTFTPITYLHLTVAPGATVTLPWPAHFNAMAYVLSGSGDVGPDSRSLTEGQLAVFAGGDALTLHAAPTQPQASAHGWEVLVLGGTPLREPVARYGPFVMSTRAEIIEAIEDFQRGTLIRDQPTQKLVSAVDPAHRTSEDTDLP
jgi:redox-sensitive bicupin YhaK (pirin superfamily)